MCGDGIAGQRELDMCGDGIAGHGELNCLHVWRWYCWTWRIELSPCVEMVLLGKGKLLNQCALKYVQLMRKMQILR